MKLRNLRRLCRTEIWRATVDSCIFFAKVYYEQVFYDNIYSKVLLKVLEMEFNQHVL